jgi:hypothetical protein
LKLLRAGRPTSDQVVGSRRRRACRLGGVRSAGQFVPRPNSAAVYGTSASMRRGGEPRSRLVPAVGALPHLPTRRQRPDPLQRTRPARTRLPRTGSPTSLLLHWHLLSTKPPQLLFVSIPAKAVEEVGAESGRFRFESAVSASLWKKGCFDAAFSFSFRIRQKRPKRSDSGLKTDQTKIPNENCSSRKPSSGRPAGPGGRARAGRVRRSGRPDARGKQP